MVEYEIINGLKYDVLEEFFRNNGLENHSPGADPEGLVETFSVLSEGMLIGAVSVVFEVGVFVVLDLAVNKEHRRKDIGSVLLKKAINKIREVSSESIYLVAKVPEFFKTHGFNEIDPKTAPEFSNCQKCDQFNVTCFPTMMCLEK